MDFDIRSYLESREVIFWTSGKNVTSGWTNIQCVFDGCADHSNHLGVNPSGSAFNCHMCGASGFILDLIQRIDKCSKWQAKVIYKSFLIEERIPEKAEKRSIEAIQFPPGSTTKIPDKAKRFLRGRRFDPNHIINKYGLRYGGISGKFKFRLIIPYYLDNKLITFSSIDITGKQKIKYKHQKVEESIIDPKHTLYNIDSVKDKMILVEGITDVWRIGDGAVAASGKIVTLEQINLILKKDVKEVLIMLDSDAEYEGENLTTYLSGLIDTVSYIDYGSDLPVDPDSLSDNDIKELKKNFF